LLVVVAPRKFTPDPEEIGKLGNSFISVAVIDLDGLQKAYGPSICSTQLFHSTEDLNRRFAIMGE
jgi:hypothetical protein